MNRHGAEFGDLAGETELLHLVRAALDQAERLPDRLLEQAYAARFMAKIDAELAELVYDSLDMPTAAMRRGSENEARFLSFTNDHVTLDLALLADHITIIGEIDPAICSEIVLEPAAGDPTTFEIDAFGRFRLTCDAVSFRLRVPGHLVTQWISRL